MDIKTEIKNRPLFFLKKKIVNISTQCCIKKQKHKHYITGFNIIFFLG